MDEFKPVERIVIDDLRTLRVLSHPLRSQILEMFGNEPLTVKQVADRLGLTSNKLYYHVNMLEGHGLLRIVETRTVGNMIEKLYRTAADRFDVDADLLSFSTSAGRDSGEQCIVSILDATREDLLRSIEARRLLRAQGHQLEPRESILQRCLSRLPKARADEFQQRLCALVEEFGQADVDVARSEGSSAGDAAAGAENDVQTYALAVVFYATSSFPEQDGTGETNPEEGKGQV